MIISRSRCHDELEQLSLKNFCNRTIRAPKSDGPGTYFWRPWPGRVKQIQEEGEYARKGNMMRINDDTGNLDLAVKAHEDLNP
jgi:hypothetical protein